MDKITEILIDLQKGKEVVCPKCKKGNLITDHDPATSTYFYCSNPDCKCKLTVN